MRIPILFSLIAVAVHAVHAAPAKPSRRPASAPAGPLGAARGVARALTPAPPPKAPARDTVIPPPPPLRGEKPAPAAPLASPAPPAPSPGTAATPVAPERPPAATAAPASLPSTTAAAAGAPAGERLTPGPGSPVLLPSPPLTLSAPRAVVPLGEKRVVTVTGAATQPEAAPTGTEVVAVTVTAAPLPGGWHLTLRGLAPGAATVRVTEGGREQLLTVQVMKFAGRVSRANVEVTGQPAPAEHVLRAARLALAGVVQVEPGATLTVGRSTTAARDLPAGQMATLSFPVTLTGPGLLPVKTTAAVTVRSRDLDRREIGVLLYSNDPERVPRHSSLFASELTLDHPARLLYHHQNATGAPLRLRVEIINPTDTPADVQVIEGLAGPNLDPILTGHRATARYVRNAMAEIGTIIRVPARSRQTVVTQRMGIEQTVGGVLGLRALDTKLFVAVVAEADSAPLVAAGPAEPPTELSDHVYPSPHRLLKASYVVGKNWAFMKLGGDPVVARGAVKKLAGNYGVSYQIALEISNPTDQPQEVAVTLSPDAGTARGVFTIDGAVVEVDAVSPPVEARLATFRLQPGERRAVRVETIPVGGSSYPARVVVRPGRPIRAAQADPDVP